MSSDLTCQTHMARKPIALSRRTFCAQNSTSEHRDVFQATTRLGRRFNLRVYAALSYPAGSPDEEPLDLSSERFKFYGFALMTVESCS